MEDQHDIYRQIEYIQQVLSQNKRPLGFFIAAGCPLSIRVSSTDGNGSEPLIPDVAGLTKIIAAQLIQNDNNKYDMLIQKMRDNDIGNPNIEEILSQIRTLKQIVGKGTIHDLNATDLLRLDTEICQIISEKVDIALPSIESPYHDLAIWIRSIEREKPVHIFTTNYDLLMEQALEESACPYFDGFIGARKAFFDLRSVEEETFLHSRWTRLWKIHGSINWRLDGNNNVVRCDKVDTDHNYLIYPSHLKYDESRKMPYLAMLDRLKAFLSTHSPVLFISGYSFSDDHINHVINQSLRSNPKAMVFAFLFGDLNANYKKAQDCAGALYNMSLFAFDKAIIGRKEGAWTLKDESRINELPAGLVEAIPTDGSNVDNITKYGKLKLGDFAKFTSFLKEISHNYNQEDAESHS